MFQHRAGGRSACGHRFDLPEVTFRLNGIASPGPPSQHERMWQRARTLLEPLNIAALLAWLAVALSMQLVSAERLLVGWSLLVAWLLAFLVHGMIDADGRERPSPWRLSLLAAELVIALILIWLDPRPGTSQVLLVIWAAQLAMRSLRGAVIAVLAADVVYYLLLRDAGYRVPLLVATMNFGFQLFAALCAYYARTAEQARDRLALVNADLLATRALLADSARDAERLRLARELHDVAGHKLTALTLNLRVLAADPALSGRQELAAAQQLSTELMADLRGVVQALRDTRGLDLATALRALAAPLPRPRLVLSIGEEVRVNDPAKAEAVLRLVQEALTNSARHGDAQTLHVWLTREGERIAVRVEDDGHVRGAVREGNGLSGMRERIAACQGTFALSTTAGGALRIDASLPA